MKKRKTALFALSCVLLMGGALASCGEEPQPSISVTEGNKVTVEAGSTIKLNVNVENFDGTTTFSSKNDTIAKVDSTGTITGIKAGTTTIVIKAGDFETTVEVTVTAKATTETTIRILGDKTFNMMKGSTKKLEVKTENFDGTVTFESSDKETATVSTEGVVEALKAGEVDITAKAGTATASVHIVITDKTDAADIITIAEAKAKEVGTPVTVKGKVSAICGKSAYISDSTGSFYVYNWSFTKDDTAIANQTWTMGQSVEIKAEIGEFNGAKQLTNFKGGARIDGTYAIAIEDEITPKAPIQLDEAGYKKLTTANVGDFYTFDAVCESETPTAGTAVSTKWKLGETQIVLRTDKFDKGQIQQLEVGATYTITAPLSWYGKNPQFSFLSQGTTLVKKV